MLPPGVPLVEIELDPVSTIIPVHLLPSGIEGKPYAFPSGSDQCPDPSTILPLITSVYYIIESLSTLALSAGTLCYFLELARVTVAAAGSY